MGFTYKSTYISAAYEPLQQNRYLDDLFNIDNPYFKTNGWSDISH